MAKINLCQHIGALFNNENTCKILLHFLIGVIVTALLVVSKLYFETYPEAHKVEVLTYEFLNSQIPAFSPKVEMPVVVLDVSKIPGRETVTSRETLKEIITELVNQKASAIAIDMEFSPTVKGWIDKKDPGFFDFCIEQRQKKVPIFLGVFRTAKQKPSTWLGSEDYKDLAADITIVTSDTTRLPVWTQKNEEQKLYSLSAALVKALDIKPKDPPEFIKFALKEPDNEETIETEGDTKRSKLIINYSKVDAIKSQSLSAISANSIRDLGERFRNKIVIVGDAAEGVASDMFIIPGQSRPVPGVFLHASAVYTQTIEPYYELNHGTKLVLDLAIGLIILLIITILRLMNTGNQVDWERKQKRYIWFAIIFCLIAGVIAVKISSILWLDFVLVIFALLLHPGAERRINKLLKLESH